MTQTAFHTRIAITDTPLFLFGDHASNDIPDALNNLGLSGDDLTRHIAWDIGTRAVIDELCDHYGCGAQSAAVSRLVIDMNRDPDAAGLIPGESDGTDIIRNQDLDAAARQARIDSYYTPYHTALGAAIAALAASTLVISVHSFTPKPLTGTQRSTDIGLLVKHDTQTADDFVAAMGTIAPHYDVAVNQPYSAYDLNYTVDRHIGADGPRHLAIELRQDHVDSDAKVRALVDILIRALDIIL